MKIVERPLAGWLTAACVAKLRQVLVAAITADDNAVLIDCTQLRYRHASGLAALAHLLTELRVAYADCPAWLCNVAPDLRAAIDLAAFEQVWNIAPNRDTALKRLHMPAQKPALLEI